MELEFISDPNECESGYFANAGMLLGLSLCL